MKRLGYVRNEPHFEAFRVQEGLNMNREHVEAAAKKVQGTVKQVVAEVTGDYNLEAEGKIDKLVGASHEVAGVAKDAAKKA